LVRNKFLLAALALIVLLSIILTVTHVSAGDEGGGGSHGIIRTLFW
jgi:hypothetical protein